MGSFSIWHWLIVLVVVLILFGGKGKISSLMGDLGKGLKSFKKQMKDETEDAAAAPPPENAPRITTPDHNVSAASQPAAPAETKTDAQAKG